MKIWTARNLEKSGQSVHTHVIDRSFNDTLAKCLLGFSSISQEKYTVQKETIISVSSISITVHFCKYSYESLLAKSIF